MPADDDIYNQAVPPEELIPEEFLNGGAFFAAEEEVVEELAAEAEAHEENILEIDDSYKEDFQRLTTLGKLTADFEWAGHNFRIRTLKTNEILEAGIIHKKYQGTIADVRAWGTIFAAACLELADGRPLPIPISKEDSLLETKFNYVLNNYYQWTIDAIFTKYRELEARVEEIILAMGKA